MWLVLFYCWCIFGKKNSVEFMLYCFYYVPNQNKVFLSYLILPYIHLYFNIFFTMNKSLCRCGLTFYSTFISTKYWTHSTSWRLCQRLYYFYQVLNAFDKLKIMSEVVLFLPSTERLQHLMHIHVQFLNRL
jgi:hypothetical protein